MTCPCGQFDFIGQANLSFAETLTGEFLFISFKNYCRCIGHREEGNRIIREFLIGEFNIDHITHGLKSDEYSFHFT